MNKLITLFKVLICCNLILLQVSETLCRIQARIVGGMLSKINNAPYLVQILYDEYCICGGTLVNENVVVTAAHCLENMQAELFTIAGGTSKLSETGIRSKIHKIMIPKSYNNKTATNDVAVIILKTAMNGPSVRPADLCEEGWKVGDSVQIYGWGLNGEDDEYVPEQMHTVEVYAISKSECQKKYLRRRTISDSMFCATAPGKDSCTGDSGGPAMINNKLCGIVSWGVGCGHSDSPGAYTDMMKVQSFVKSAMQL